MFFSGKLRRLGLLCLLSISLSACASSPPDGGSTQPNAKPVKLTLDFSTSPATVHVGQAAALQLHVKKVEQPVDDAKVEMEIWREGDERHLTEKAEHTDTGMYVLQKNFTQPGQYHVILHTTTSEIHQMPKVDFSVEQ